MGNKMLLDAGACNLDPRAGALCRADRCNGLVDETCSQERRPYLRSAFDEQACDAIPREAIEERCKHDPAIALRVDVESHMAAVGGMRGGHEPGFVSARCEPHHGIA